MDPLSKLELHSIIDDVLGTYIKDVSFSYFFKIERFSHPNLNRYDIGTKMSLHQDHIYSLFNGTIKGIPILSIVGLLNNEFEGGEFVLWGDEIIRLEAGDILVFPSLFAYPHHVNTVTKGSRYSFVSWAH
jgi:predicted 2-oxoglutarate/Fe(II)-dependent dioxygenase YbiX